QRELNSASRTEARKGWFRPRGDVLERAASGRGLGQGERKDGPGRAFAPGGLPDLPGRGFIRPNRPQTARHGTTTWTLHPGTLRREDRRILAKARYSPDGSRR